MPYVLAYSACNSQNLLNSPIKGCSNVHFNLAKTGCPLHVPPQVQPKMVTTLSQLQDDRRTGDILTLGSIY